MTEIPALGFRIMPIELTGVLLVVNARKPHTTLTTSISRVFTGSQSFHIPGTNGCIYSNDVIRFSSISSVCNSLDWLYSQLGSSKTPRSSGLATRKRKQRISSVSSEKLEGGTDAHWMVWATCSPLNQDTMCHRVNWSMLAGPSSLRVHGEVNSAPSKPQRQRANKSCPQRTVECCYQKTMLVRQ
jgi:hypothetical protein